MIKAKRDTLKSEFIGLVNSSYSALGTLFEGSYSWTKKYGEPVRAVNIADCLMQHGFVFFDSRKTKDKVPCVIAGNLISDRIDYAEKSKAKMDTSPFVDTIRVAVSKVSRGIKSFESYGIEFERDRHSSSSSYRVSARPRYSTTYIKDVVEMMLLPRINKVRAGETITTEQTQDSLWYNALPLFEKHNVRYSNKSRQAFKKYIRDLCEEYGVAREQIGIIASTLGHDVFWRMVRCQL